MYIYIYVYINENKNCQTKCLVYQANIDCDIAE